MNKTQTRSPIAASHVTKIIVTLVIVTLVGCGAEEPKPKADAKAQSKTAVSQSEQKKAPEVPKEKPAPKKSEPPAAKTVEEAKTELQNRIARFLGGQRKDAVSLIGGIMAIRSVTVEMTQIEILTLTQEYSEDGKESPNRFVGTLKYQGTYKTTGAPERGQAPIHIRFGDGKWDAY